MPYPDLCQQKKLNFHTYMSVDNMGSLNFHPSPRLVKSPSLSPLGQCQRRTSEESRLLPSRSNEATPNPTVSGEAIRSTGTSHRSKSLRILAPGHNPMWDFPDPVIGDYKYFTWQASAEKAAWPSPELVQSQCTADSEGSYSQGLRPTWLVLFLSTSDL